MKTTDKSCPSATCEEGAILLGVVNGDGTIGYISTPMTVDHDFVQEVHEQGNPESSFRFSNKCVTSGCRQWSNGQCGVINKIIHNNEDLDLPPRLPECSIRSSCRWYYQEGAKACSFCPYIITNMLEKKKTEVPTE
ncbi:hypothetical protein [Paraflavitalea pollutisoli]|uniref:hypothetical protein n=1 Tax=Paraflavitalea pollutisoli TaxID=3034143 RepID=UPI0023EB2F6E|nr:hypothetical protein [Paraflavitalea sp. H1-2-19X]